ncbi:NAPDH-dependent diflavin reductase [Dimargaris xerosporica]|nr:NAPDH-dependent diflavin reductase [Dimargaris xerosporica]
MHEPILILYGSQTGCAEDVALRIGREAKRRHFRPEIMAMDALDRTRLPHIPIVIFVCSTTGQGEEPDNMKAFWRFLLRKAIPANALSRMKYTVFGLGDSSYTKYNFPARKLTKRLLQLGARCFYPKGEGDDQHYLGLDGALDPWLQGLWECLLAKYPRPSDIPIIPDSVRPDPTYRVTFFSEEEENTFKKESDPGLEPPLVAAQATMPSVHVPMTLNKNYRMTAQDHFQDVRHLELQATADYAQQLTFQPGDIACLTPRNLPSEVDSFLDHMGWQSIADRPLLVTPLEPWVHLPALLRRPVTLRTLFEMHFDIYSVPRRSFFEMLSYFTHDEMETEKLREFISAEGQDDLYAYSHRMRRTVVEVLNDFQSHEIPLDYLFDVFPDIRPRSFSIASSLHAHPGQIHLAIGIVRYTTMIKTPRRGVCTKWIETLDPTADAHIVLSVTFKRGTMVLPKSSDSPLIMIGPGTGIAPMRAFIQERVFQEAQNNILFFGCRHADKDYLYGQEWAQLEAQGMLKVFSAFSRDQDQKIYVQHRITEQGAYLWPLIASEGATIVVSGNANRMPEDVKDAFLKVIQVHGKMTAYDAHSYIRQMEKSRRYQEECWY